jgi:DNA-binding HxlR family transcriptional regulator
MDMESKITHQECENICFCPLKGIIDVISKKWALLIINSIGNNDRPRFKRLMTVLPGISPKTLSDTLKNLEEEGLIRRESFSEIPPRVEYTLTKDGIELREAIIPLLKWTATRNGRTRKCDPFCKTVSSHIVKSETIEGDSNCL